MSPQSHASARPQVREPDSAGNTIDPSIADEDFFFTSLEHVCCKWYISAPGNYPKYIEDALQTRIHHLPLGMRLHRFSPPPRTLMSSTRYSRALTSECAGVYQRAAANPVVGFVCKTFVTGFTGTNFVWAPGRCVMCACICLFVFLGVCVCVCVCVERGQMCHPDFL